MPKDLRMHQDSLSIIGLITNLRINSNLIFQMSKRDVLGRYKGSAIGLLWSFLNPILMLAIYTFVFAVVFKARWGTNPGESKTEFALVLFVGLIVYGLFAEAINRAPTLIISNVNYVKKIVFPLETLPIISILGALFHFIVSFLVLIMAQIIINGSIHWTIIFTPFIIFPLILITLGISWLLASLGVYLRDIGQSIGIITTILMFMSPVFYPITSLPEQYRPIILANPLTFTIEQFRSIVVWGVPPDWIGLIIYTAISIGMSWIGYAWFQMTRKGFADVI